MKRRSTNRFTRTENSVPLARAWLQGELVTSIGPIADPVDSALLGLSEIATNAVQHGAGRYFWVTYTLLGGALTIESLDGGKGGRLPAVETPPAAESESGRGLFIVDQISDGDWEYNSDFGGRMRVWFRLRVHAEFPVRS